MSGQAIIRSMPPLPSPAQNYISNRMIATSVMIPSVPEIHAQGTGKTRDAAIVRMPPLTNMREAAIRCGVLVFSEKVPIPTCLIPVNAMSAENPVTGPSLRSRQAAAVSRTPKITPDMLKVSAAVPTPRSRILCMTWYPGESASEIMLPMNAHAAPDYPFPQTETL